MNKGFAERNNQTKFKFSGLQLQFYIHDKCNNKRRKKKQFQQKAKISKMGKFSIFLGKNQQNEKSIKTAQRPSTRFNN